MSKAQFQSMSGRFIVEIHGGISAEGVEVRDPTVLRQFEEDDEQEAILFELYGHALGRELERQELSQHRVAINMFGYIDFDGTPKVKLTRAMQEQQQQAPEHEETVTFYVTTTRELEIHRLAFNPIYYEMIGEIESPITFKAKIVDCTVDLFRVEEMIELDSRVDTEVLTCAICMFTSEENTEENSKENAEENNTEKKLLF